GAHQRCFACAIEPDQRMHLAGCHAEATIEDTRFRAKGPRCVMHLDYVRHLRKRTPTSHQTGQKPVRTSHPREPVQKAWPLSHRRRQAFGCSHRLPAESRSCRAANRLCRKPVTTSKSLSTA